MQLSQLERILSATRLGEDTSFTGFSTDSRSIQPGELFVAIEGENFDGHTFLREVKARGAAAALVSKPQYDCAIPQIIVADTRRALAVWARWHRMQFPQVRVVGITGSCGKTTTKEMLAAIFSTQGETLAARKSFNNDIGVPLTLLQLSDQHRYVVLEIGANHPHEIAPLARLADLDAAIITGVAPVHIEGFGDLQTIAVTKGEIFQGLKQAGVAILNREDDFYHFWQQNLRMHPILSFGCVKEADVHATDISLSAQGQAKFILHIGNDNVAIQLPLLGRHNIYNALAASAAAYAMGVPLRAIKQGLENMQPAAHRLQVLTGRQGVHIIDDSYNANPLAVKAALEILSRASGERVWVFFDMRELGHMAEDAHRQVGAYAKKLGIQRLFALGELSRLTVEAFGEGAMHFADQTQLLDALQGILRPGMTILIKGSRSGRLEKIVEAIAQ